MRASANSMRFVFTKLFYALLTLGFVPLSLSWGRPSLRWLAIGFDAALLVAAFADSRTSRMPARLEIVRELEGRFHIGMETAVRVLVLNHTPRSFSLRIKDEYPPEMILSARRRAREAELKALGARSLVAAHRRSIWRGEGRDFESMRDYVPGDELRHVSWSATARRGKLTTRQYQIERDQTIIIALDAGRLMTGRIEQETKFDSAINAALALMSAAERGGDVAGLVVFGRRIRAYVPPAKGREQTDRVLEALHAIEPEMIEPSYTRAFEYLAANCKRRALIVVLTDLVDEEGSRELLTSLRILRPRHLPLVVTIADRDLRASVQHTPESIGGLFAQSVAEEIMLQREAALRHVEAQGGLALDVTAAALVPSLLETYIRVKERGLL
ncbi:MAG: DUF58 domain-containing protein [Acidobacteria bacterium]|nr:DUF58 domain-containing protein [Acidobacteriota bacterium]